MQKKYELIKRLREADEKSMCGECGLNLHTGATKKGVLFAEAADAIEELNSIGAVPVVRCKDCKWYCEGHCGLRQIIARLPEEFFCADGEKREES